MPDYNQDLELSALGCLLTFYHELWRRMDDIAPDDFFFDESKEILAAIPSCAGEESGRKCLDMPMLQARLSRPAVDAGAAALNAAVTSVFFDGYLLELKNLARQRRVRAAAAMLAQKPQITDEDIQTLAEAGKGSGFTANYRDQSRAALDKFTDNLGKKQPRITTGLGTLDQLTGGLRLGTVCMIGAYPSVGKTAFALNVADHQTGPVVIFSLEMSAAMIYERLIAARKLIDYRLIGGQTIPEGLMETARACMAEIKSRSVFVFDDIYDQDAQMAVVRSVQPCLVVVDYLQRVRTRRRSEGRRMEVEYLSGEYKRMAALNNCVVMLLSQLARGERGQPPTMSSLKESGALEADGDYVALLDRPYVQDKTRPPQEASLLLDKNKFGRTGKIPLRFEGKFQKFYDLETGDRK